MVLTKEGLFLSFARGQICTEVSILEERGRLQVSTNRVHQTFGIRGPVSSRSSTTVRGLSLTSE